VGDRGVGKKRKGKGRKTETKMEREKKLRGKKKGRQAEKSAGGGLQNGKKGTRGNL